MRKDAKDAALLLFAEEASMTIKMTNGANRVEEDTRCAIRLCLLNKRVNCDDRDDVDAIREMQKMQREDTRFIVNASVILDMSHIS
jgi:hypothetical protein